MIPLIRRRTFIWRLAAGFLIVAGCQSGDGNSKVGTHPMLPFGYVEVPNDGATLQKVAEIAGWVLCEDGVEEVAIYLDRSYIATATLGISRPDVAKSVPQIENNGSAGWQASIDVTRIGAGRHQLLVQARSKKGATSDLGKITVSVIQ